MSVIQQDDLHPELADALHYISYYHRSIFFLHHLARPGLRFEQSPAAEGRHRQILIPTPMCAEGRRPICHDPAWSLSS